MTADKHSTQGKKGDSSPPTPHEEVHTRARSPQHKKDNKSHAEIAKSSSAPFDDFVFINPDDLDGFQVGDHAASDRADSQDTLSTGATTLMNTNPDLRPTRAMPKVGLPLTRGALDINNRQPQHAYAGNISDWLGSVSGVGDVYRAAEYQPSVASSMHTTWTGNPETNMMSSMLSSMGFGCEPVGVASNDDILLGTGAWASTRCVIQH